MRTIIYVLEDGTEIARLNDFAIDHLRMLDLVTVFKCNDNEYFVGQRTFDIDTDNIIITCRLVKDGGF